MEKPNIDKPIQNPAIDAVSAIQEILNPKLGLESNGDYILIHHTEGLEPYEIKKESIRWVFDLVKTLEYLEGKSWMNAQLAKCLVHYHAHINHPIDDIEFDVD